MEIVSFLDSCTAGGGGKSKLLCSCKISIMHGSSQLEGRVILQELLKST